MKKNLYTIGEVAKITGLTIKALRFYDKIGLLRPYKVDEITGYRYYHFDQFMLINIIIAGRSMGISPNDLVPLFKAGDSEGLTKLLKTHKELTKARISELVQTVEAINGIENTFKTSRESLGNRGVYKKHLPERHAILLPYDHEKSREALIMDFSRLEISAVKRGLINTYESGILFENCDGAFRPSHLFTGIAKAADVPDYSRIPEGAYICVNYSQEDALKKMNALTRHLTENEVEPAGLVQIELLGDLFDSENTIFELQARLPV